jgi:rhodanese-related sulfurtransferase
MVMNPYSYKKICVLVFLAALWLLGCSHSQVVDVHELSALEAKTLIDQNRGKSDFVILDLRTPKEFASGHIEGAVMLDYYSPGFQQGLQQLDRSKRYLIYCRTGNRSSRTLKLIDQMGFISVYHLKDGIVDWNRQKLPLAKL